jgi:hypothetical protein
MGAHQAAVPNGLVQTAAYGRLAALASIFFTPIIRWAGGGLEPSFPADEWKRVPALLDGAREAHSDTLKNNIIYVLPALEGERAAKLAGLPEHSGIASIRQRKTVPA